GRRANSRKRGAAPRAAGAGAFARLRAPGSQIALLGRPDRLAYARGRGAAEAGARGDRALHAQDLEHLARDPRLERAQFVEPEVGQTDAALLGQAHRPARNVMRLAEAH